MKAIQFNEIPVDGPHRLSTTVDEKPRKAVKKSAPRKVAKVKAARKPAKVKGDTAPIAPARSVTTPPETKA